MLKVFKMAVLLLKKYFSFFNKHAYTRKNGWFKNGLAKAAMSIKMLPTWKV